MLENWQTAIICSIHLKGDKLQCNNCRGTSLFKVRYKVLTNILHRWLVPYAAEILGDCPCGFRARRSITDNLFTLRCILENFYELNLYLHFYLLILNRLMTQWTGHIYTKF